MQRSNYLSRREKKGGVILYEAELCVCVFECAVWEKAKNRNWLSTYYNRVEDSSKECQIESSNPWSKASQKLK